MLVTEEEATGKLCPLLFSQPVETGMYKPSYYCSASGCMAWRWWWNSDSKKSDERKGFCGIAGKPMQARVVSMKQIVTEEE